MLFLSDVRDYIATLGIAADGNVYTGKLDNKKNLSIGVYQRKTSRPPSVSLGNTGTYKVKQVSFLIHWNKSFSETEAAAASLYEALESVRQVMINNKKIYYFKLLQEEPIDVDKDEKGINEQVIEADIFYER